MLSAVAYPTNQKHCLHLEAVELLMNLYSKTVRPLRLKKIAVASKRAVGQEK